MSRYKVTERPWFAENDQYAPFIVEVTDCVDTRNGTVYADGAYRVTINGKPAKRGKGGTVPFYGETARSYADRLANDLWWEHRRNVG